MSSQNELRFKINDADGEPIIVTQTDLVNLEDMDRRGSATLDKIWDADSSTGLAVPFDPEEAEEAGFFLEDAITYEEAEEAALDNDLEA